jgi:hypothetical protein
MNDMGMPATFADKLGKLPHGATQIGFVSDDPGRVATPDELDFHASGFVARVEGVWTNADLAQFRHFLNLHHLVPTNEELISSIQRATREYLQGDNRLYLCGANPCCNACSFDTSDTALAAAGRMGGLPVSITGCQGQCKHAPVLSLRVGDRSQMFAPVASEDDWLAELTFVKTAVQADSLLVSPGEAETFLHDPVHEPGRPDVHLKALRFLVGHFRGEGRCIANGYTFQKEVIGTFEAGGRFISLRMAASYPLADGRKDTHRALVIVGQKPTSRSITGHAYTDGGNIREYEVEQHDPSLLFADSPPDCTRQWKHSRKLLKPTNEGFEERLEVDAGEGFITFYTIPMRKIATL